MATKLEFNYETWDPKKDVLLEHAGSILGFGVVQTATEVGRAPDKRSDTRDQLVGPSLDGIYGLLASCLEWLRWYGEDKATVESRVKNVIKRYAGGSPARAEAFQAAFRAMDHTELADGNNLKGRLDKNKVIG